jgi:hypothetical protein
MEMIQIALIIIIIVILLGLVYLVDNKCSSTCNIEKLTNAPAKCEWSPLNNSDLKSGMCRKNDGYPAWNHEKKNLNTVVKCFDICTNTHCTHAFDSKFIPTSECVNKCENLGWPENDMYYPTGWKSIVKSLDQCCPEFDTCATDNMGNGYDPQQKMQECMTKCTGKTGDDEIHNSPCVNSCVTSCKTDCRLSTGLPTTIF